MIGWEALSSLLRAPVVPFNELLLFENALLMMADGRIALTRHFLFASHVYSFCFRKLKVAETIGTAKRFLTLFPAAG